MNASPPNQPPVLSFLIEHARGTCEVWVRCHGDQTVRYEPVKVVPVSGTGTVLLNSALIARAIALDEWVADHFDVFAKGRTVFDDEPRGQAGLPDS